MSELVSIIMPLYNSVGFMEKSVRSALDQSYTDLELILIDDASKDATVAAARQFASSDPRIVLIEKSENGGACETRNTGIAHARGRFIAFLDSDDLWGPDKLETQLAGMAEKSASISYTDYNVIDEAGHLRRVTRAPERLNRVQLMKNTVIGCSTVIYDAGKLGKRYFPNIGKHEDLALWLSILKDVDFAYRCGGALTSYMVRRGSLSANKLKAATYTWKIYREIEKLSLLPAAYNFAWYALSSIRRRMG